MELSETVGKETKKNKKDHQHTKRKQKSLGKNFI
jgi:hypothetical protein